MSKKGVYPIRSTLLPSDFLPHNQSLVPIREKFVGPPLFSKAVAVAKVELDSCMHRNYPLVSCCLTLHLATTSLGDVTR